MKSTMIIVASIATVALGAMLFNAQPQASAHCQIPCGIYDDAARIQHLFDDRKEFGVDGDLLKYGVQREQIVDANGVVTFEAIAAGPGIE